MTIALPRPRTRNAFLERLLTIQFGLGARGAVGVGLATQRGGAAAVPDWWQVAGKTTLRAYQPKGAANLAASYSNLPTPGTGDAQTGTAPTWDAANGWKFDAASTQWLSAQLLNDDVETVVILFSNASSAGDYRSGGSLFTMFPNWFGSFNLYQRRGGSLFGGAPYTSGTIGIAGQQAYKNGDAAGAAMDNTIPRNWPILIAATSVDDSVPPVAATQHCTWYVQAWVALQEELNSTEMAALHAAMAAL